MEAFKVLSQDRVCCSVLLSRSLKFLFLPVEVRTSLILVLGMGIYALLHWMSEARDPPGVRVRGCTRTRAHGRLAAYGAEEAAYPDIEYEFFDYGGFSWVRRWIPFVQGLLGGSLSLIGAGKGLGRGLSGTSSEEVWMVMVVVALFGGVKGVLAERSHHAPVHIVFGRFPLHFLVDVDPDPQVITQNGKVCPVVAFGCGLRMRVCTWNWTSFL